MFAHWIEYGLRDLPIPLYLDDEISQHGKVTLTTTKHQEFFAFLRPNFEGYGPDEAPDRRTRADLNPNLPNTYPFYRADSPQTFFRLPELRPSVLYVFGGKSSISYPKGRLAKMDTTGTGVGGGEAPK